MFLSREFRAVLLVLVSFAVRAEVVPVDVNEWAETGTGMTNGWVVSGIDCYSGEKGARFDAQDDFALSPEYPGFVTQLVLRVRASSETPSRSLTAVPVVSKDGALSLTAEPAKSYADQTLVWRPDDGVRRFRLQNIGTGPAGWGIRSLSVCLERPETPMGLQADLLYSDALPVRWEPSPHAVSNSVEVSRVTTVWTTFDLLKEWDFTSLTNTSGNTVNIAGLNPPESLDDVGGTELCLQGNAGGHLQVGKRDAAGTMALPLPDGLERTAVMMLFKNSADDDDDAEVCYVGEGDVTNALARPFLTVRPTSFAVAIPDDATSLVFRSRTKHRIRVENVKIVADYIPGSVMTNAVASVRTAKNEKVVKGLAPGNWLWRVKSYDRDGRESLWSSYQEVTLTGENPPFGRRGIAVIIR